MNEQSSSTQFAGQSRIHVGLTVQDLEKAAKFYETLLGVSPSKQRANYAKFEPAEPSVNLSLNELDRAVEAAPPHVHYGIQVKSSAAVEVVAKRLESQGIEAERESGTTCCYSVQDKVWATDPDGNRWEVFFVVDSDVDERQNSDGSCCTEECCPSDESSETPASSCC